MLLPLSSVVLVSFVPVTREVLDKPKTPFV